jgi:thioredoxin
MHCFIQIAAVKAAKYPTISAVLLALALISCGPSKTETNGNDLPLITNSEELSAASDKAGDRMVVLDLYADWCMPCKVLQPVLHELAVEYKNKAFFYRVNVDRSPDLVRAFGVRGIPYIVFMKQNKAVYTLTGVNPKESYRKILDICKGTSSPDECVGQLNERM